MDDFKVTALSGDGAVAVVARLDFSGRGRPSEMIAITKKNGLFQYALLAAGEGAYGIGTLDKVLVELDKTGSKAIVLDERAPADDKGNVYASADAAPTVTNIYALANGRLSLVNKSHGDYYKSTVIPRLTARLDNARNQAATADDPEMLENLQQQIDSLSKSVDLATQAGGGAASQ
jgi:hypothetical protein